MNLRKSKLFQFYHIDITVYGPMHSEELYTYTPCPGLLGSRCVLGNLEAFVEADSQVVTDTHLNHKKGSNYYHIILDGTSDHHFCGRPL